MSLKMEFYLRLSFECQNCGQINWMNKFVVVFFLSIAGCCYCWCFSFDFSFSRDVVVFQKKKFFKSFVIVSKSRQHTLCLFHMCSYVLCLFRLIFFDILDIDMIRQYSETDQPNCDSIIHENCNMFHRSFCFVRQSIFSNSMHNFHKILI